MNVPSIESGFYIYNNVITSIAVILGVMLIDFVLILLGKLLNKRYKFNLSKYYIGNIYILSFIIRLIPVLGHIGSILMGINNISMKKIILVYVAGYIFFLSLGHYFFPFT